VCLNFFVGQNKIDQSMRNIRTIILVALAITYGASHGRAADTRDAITSTVLACVKGIATGNVELIASTFAEDATAFFPTKSAARISGKTAIAEAFAALFGPKPRPTTITPREMVIQEMGDVAIVTAHLRDLPAMPIREVSTFPRRTFVLRHVEGRWLIVHLHASNYQLVPVAPAQGEAK
jgi:uncharacterized protein (TIGR02246 family)